MSFSPTFFFFFHALGIPQAMSGTVCIVKLTITIT